MRTTKVQTMDPIGPRKCYVCGDEAYQPEHAKVSMTHNHCKPGTDRWVDWYKQSGRRTDAGEIILAIYNRKRNARKGGA